MSDDLKEANARILSKSVMKNSSHSSINNSSKIIAEGPSDDFCTLPPIDEFFIWIIQGIKWNCKARPGCHFPKSSDKNIVCCMDYSPDIDPTHSTSTSEPIDMSLQTRILSRNIALTNVGK